MRGQKINPLFTNYHSSWRVTLSAWNAITDSILNRGLNMSRLLVRNLEPEIVQALKRQAARHGRSAEAEHREILKQTLLRPRKKTFAQVLADMPNVGNDSDFERVEDIGNNSVFT